MYDRGSEMGGSKGPEKWAEQTESWPAANRRRPLRSAEAGELIVHVGEVSTVTCALVCVSYVMHRTSSSLTASYPKMCDDRWG